MSTQRGISLLRQPQDRVFVPNRGEGFRLRIEAHAAVDMVPEIFLHQRSLVDPATGLQQEEFVCVCSAFDLTIYPANEPDAAQFPQFFRKSHLDIIVPSQAVAEDAWTIIFNEVNVLVASLNKLDDLSLGTLVRCGAELPVSYSESVSISS